MLLAMLTAKTETASIMSSYASSLTWIFVVACFVLGVGYLLYLGFKAKYHLKWIELSGALFGVIVAILLVHAIIFWPTNQLQISSELACLSGASLGWLLGIYLSPIGSTEASKFSGYWAAIGVGSAAAIKVGYDFLSTHHFWGWVKDNPLVSILFAISFVITAAAVYNTRAYEGSLTIAPRTPLPGTAKVSAGGIVQINNGTSAEFYTAVTGPADPFAIWQVFPPELGSVGPNGLFTAGATAGTGRITAFNLEDPTLSNAINIQVV